MAKPKCVPLKITAHLVDGRINSSDGVIMFDSILYHAWFRKHYPQVFLDTASETYNGYIGLPLKHLDGNRWAASRGIYTEVGANIEHYNKRPDFFSAKAVDFLDMEQGLISDSVGKFRAYRQPQLIRTVQDATIIFFAVGHADEIQDLLSYIPAVGKKPAMGWGIIDKWAVEPADEDYTTWHPKFGLMRPLEVEKDEITPEAQKYPCMLYGIRPPYWKSVNQRLCRVPIGGSK